MQNLDFSFAQDPNTLSLAIIYGMIPAVLWLFFWLKENKDRKKRTGLLMALFFAGAFAVIAALPAEEFVAHLSNNPNVLNVLWAATEELLKFGVFAAVVLSSSSKNISDPIDYPIYIMVAALGFAGFENALYFLAPLQAGNTVSIILSGSMRFLGTTLLHAACSCLVGISLGLAYFKSKRTAVLYGCVGLVAAVSVHSSFNYFIAQNNEVDFFKIFCALWLLAVGIIIFLEVLRRMGGIENRAKKEHAFFAHIEELFSGVLSLSGSAAGDMLPLADEYVSKGFAKEGPEFKKLNTLIGSLRALYGAYLLSGGADRKKISEVSSVMVPDAISAQMAASVISMLKGEIEHSLEELMPVHPKKKKIGILPEAPAPAPVLPVAISSIPTIGASSSAKTIPLPPVVPLVPKPVPPPVVTAPAPIPPLPIAKPLPPPPPPSVPTAEIFPKNFSLVVPVEPAPVSDSAPVTAPQNAASPVLAKEIPKAPAAPLAGKGEQGFSPFTVLNTHTASAQTPSSEKPPAVQTPPASEVLPQK